MWMVDQCFQYCKFIVGEWYWFVFVEYFVCIEVKFEFIESNYCFFL